MIRTNNKNSKWVSGPFNIAHLKGKIDGITKDIYLLFDVHFSINKQKKCEDFDIKNAKSIEEFIDKICKNATKNNQVDFMLEVFLSHLFSVYPKLREEHIYINKLRIFMQKNFTMDEKGTMIIKSKKYPNARLHYIDIRDVFMELVEYSYVVKIAYNSKLQNEQLKNDTWKKNISRITKIYNRIKKIHKYLSGNKKVNKYNFLKIYSKKSASEIKVSEQIKMILYIIHKVRNKYTHQSVKNLIEYIINNELSKCFNDITKIYILLTEQKKGKDFFILITHLYNYILDYSLVLMDIYAIRRVLDKDYIKKAFLYIGYAHATHYMVMLMKHMDFKLVNISKLNLPTIDKLKEKIDKVNDYKNIIKYVAAGDDVELQQCTDYSMFPNII